MKETALLYFSRNLQDEFEAKGFGMSFNQFQKFYQYLQNKAIEILNESGLPVIKSYSNEQVGSCFGERLTHELESIKKQGYHSVIIIGNDAPELSLQDITKAYNHLKRGRATLGADKRGGAYLMSFSFIDVNLTSFRDLAWHSSHVYSELQSLLVNAKELKSRADLNRRVDLLELISLSTLSKGAIRFLKSLYKSIHSRTEVAEFETSAQFMLSFRRGPPALV